MLSQLETMTTISVPCKECAGSYDVDPRTATIEKLGGSIDLVVPCPMDGSEVRFEDLAEINGRRMSWAPIERRLLDAGAKVVLWRHPSYSQKV